MSEKQRRLLEYALNFLQANLSQEVDFIGAESIGQLDYNEADQLLRNLQKLFGFNAEGIAS